MKCETFLSDIVCVIILLVWLGLSFWEDKRNRLKHPKHFKQVDFDQFKAGYEEVVDE